MEILGLHPNLGLSALAADLSVIPGEVSGLMTDGVFHWASGMLTSVVYIRIWTLGQLGRVTPLGGLPTNSSNSVGA
jgi:hypothetical protein